MNYKLEFHFEDEQYFVLFADNNMYIGINKEKLLILKKLLEKSLVSVNNFLNSKN